MDKWPMKLMVYGGGEAINGAGALSPSIMIQLKDLAQVCTNPFVASTAQLDASGGPTKRLVLDPSGRQPIYSLPNVNVGDPENLIDFFDWSENICPADRNVLVLSGHGAAWMDSQADMALGIASPAVIPSLNRVGPEKRALHHPRALFGNRISPSVSNTRALLIDGKSRDYLSNAELGNVCEKIATKMDRQLDAIVFDACLMSSWEILHELKGATRTVVASIDELSAAGIPLSLAATKLTAQRGIMDSADIARTFAETFLPQADFDSCVAIDISAPAWGEALGHFEVCCSALLTWLSVDPTNSQALQKAMVTASSSLVQYQGRGLADIGSLAMALANLPSAPAAVKTSAALTATCLASCVIGHVSGIDYQRATGLSIFCPTSHTVFLANRTDYFHLKFAIATRWLAVLDDVFNFGPGTH